MRKSSKMLIVVACLGFMSSSPPEIPLADTRSSVGSLCTVAVLPLSNLTDARDAGEKIMAFLLPVLSGKGFRVLENERVADFLEKKRIRYVDSLVTSDARVMSSELGIKYILTGSIFSYSSRVIPQVGIHVRLIDASTNEMVWCAASSMTGDDEPGLFNAGRIETRDEMIRKVIEHLFSSLNMKKQDGSILISGKKRGGENRILAPNPHYYRKKGSEIEKYDSIALIPFSNKSGDKYAAKIVHDYLFVNLSSSADVKIAEPAELRRVLSRGKIRNANILTHGIMDLLRTELGVKGVISGTVYTFREGVNGAMGGEPEIEIFAQMTDTATGEIIWAARQRREGNDSIISYDIGRVRNIDSLAGSAIANMLSTLVK